jgi:glycosyltransferase involved in cell wall biosynthesis
MKIVIAALGSSKHLSGVSRHAANIARCLLTRPEVSEVHMIAARRQCRSLLDALPPNHPRLRLHCISLGGSALRRNLWYYFQLPPLAAQLDADVVHLAYPVPINRRAFRCPTVVTLHDLYPYDIPANFGFPKVHFNRIVLQQCLRAADAIACVSESTLGRLEIHAPEVALRKTVAIYNCVEQRQPGPPGAASRAAHSPLGSLDRACFLLCVAQHRRNKNIPLAIEIFSRLLAGNDIAPTTLLVVVGIEGPETARIHRAIAAAGLTRQVVLLQGVSDAALQWLYGHAELLLAPSLVEGFGLPVVEAMLHHCPVVCSDIPAFREVGGGYCHYAGLQTPRTPLAPQGLAAEAFVHATRTALNRISFRPAATDRFAAPRIAEAYMQLYSRLLGGDSVRGCGVCDQLPSLAPDRGRP